MFCNGEGVSNKINIQSRMHMCKFLSVCMCSKSKLTKYPKSIEVILFRIEYIESYYAGKLFLHLFCVEYYKNVPFYMQFGTYKYFVGGCRINAF